MKSPHSAIALCLTLGLVSSSLVILSRLEQSASAAPRSTTGKPGRTEPGGRRGNNCVIGDIQPTALVPTVQGQTAARGLTQRPHPDFFVYLPKSTAQTAEFVVTDDNAFPLYKTILPLTGKAGVLRLRLPASEPPLAVGKNYRWMVALICNPEARSQDIGTSAWVQRRPDDASLSQRLQRATPQERLKLYGNAGLWQDLLSQLADLRQAQPTDASLATEWSTLLQDVGLPQVSDAPLLR